MPGLVNVYENVCAVFKAADESGPLLFWLVTVCASASWFVQVTVVPTLTVIAAGLKAKPLMVTGVRGDGCRVGG